MQLDSKTLVAIIVLLGTFILLGSYAWRGTTPDAVMVAVISPLAGAAVGYFFGRANGTAEANLLAVLNERRSNITQLPIQVTPIVPPKNDA
jgi:hypothetical protein